jgi:hypothetical protein
MSAFATYASFHSEGEASELTELLQSAGIAYEIEHNRNVLDKIYTGDEVDPMVAVRIRKDQFKQVNDIRRELAKNEIGQLSPDYYLFSFSNEELIDVVRNKNEWNSFDQGIAEQLLIDGNINFDRTIIENKPSKTYTPSKLSSTYLVLEYLLSILLPYAGIIIGIATIAAYRTLADGSTVKMYDEHTRNHGRIILVIGVLRTVYFLTMNYVLWYI